MCMGLPTPASTQPSDRQAGVLTLVMGGLLFVLVMWGAMLLQGLRRSVKS